MVLYYSRVKVFHKNPSNDCFSLFFFCADVVEDFGRPDLDLAEEAVVLGEPLFIWQIAYQIAYQIAVPTEEEAQKPRGGQCGPRSNAAGRACHARVTAHGGRGSPPPTVAGAAILPVDGGVC